jgi:eukaryotic-like serine/threonine-protein kinase
MAGNPDVLELLEEMLDSGRTAEEVCRDCPELLPEVRRRWKAFRLVDGSLAALFPDPEKTAGPDAVVAVPHPTDLPQVPGYRVEAVLGRGGMGVVYRAWHLRLNRVVALKMLLAGPCARPEELERFQREAEAVAALGHSNIVQVHDVGDVDGRPYFTMELVEGGSLAEQVQGVPQPARQAAALVATLADAIHAAHQGGIVHRDLKPGNILLTRDGTPKVTDFGLARRLEGDGGLTLSGVPMGTPSYMAPEQARGQKAAIGPATDVYALGAILYELLTGRPPFCAESATATLQQVVAEEPVPPARLNPRVPRDLDTICLECLHKEPQRRYGSAAALADDLRRFDRGEPIAARPLGRLGRLARWARRRPTAAALSGVLVVTALLALALVGGGLWLTGQRQATAQAAEDDLREADELLQQSDLPGARAALERAKGRLGAGGWSDVQQRVQQAEAELQRREDRVAYARQLEKRLETIRLGRCNLVDGHFDRLGSDREYEAMFRSAGLSPFQEEPKVVADRIKESPARSALVAALDDWAVCAANAPRRNWLLAVARRADSDPWRDRVRASAAFWKLANLKGLTRDTPIKGQSVQLLVALGERLFVADRNAAIPFLRQVQQAHPSDFYANLWLGVAEEPGVDVGYFRAALALRPDAAVAHCNLGIALDRQGRTDEALGYLERAVHLDPEYALGHGVLANALRTRGRTDDAIRHYREALRLAPKTLWARNNLGLVLEEKWRLDEAIAQYEEALRIDPGYEYAHYQLAKALPKRGRREEAVEHFRAALAANPRFLDARGELGLLLLEMGRLEEAADHLRQVVALAPHDRAAQEGLREALIRRGRLEEARSAWRKALDAGPPEHDAWFGYAELCLFLGQEGEYRRAGRDLLVRFRGSTDPAVAERTGRACLLLPGTKEEMEEAAALTDRAVAAGRAGHEFGYPYYVFARGLADYRLGRWADALARMRGEAARAEYLGPCPRLVTAMALHRKGQKDQALKTLAAAVVSYDWSAATAMEHDAWITHILRREAEALILPSLPAFLEGKYQPKDNGERLALVGACQFRGRRAAEAGLLAAAFAADPKLAEDPGAGLRYRAARAAAVAGCGGGADGAGLSEPERARWRQQARAWLRLDLAARTKRLEAGQPADRDQVQKALVRWRDDPDLVGLRDADALERLPAVERRECRLLWQEVAALLRRAETTR